eukprot:CAMPEP_0113454252 /NCGR_PEP_ID=MMETSP0014_2-20120614/7768_1 /TAXON_ID=2857 /ORGANISM="Nitzschia sp." /LENGTH=561 /DNA_ID=CAMNT_0000345653 /DNA_START=215 /DNA_END=1897 /DNA_ORIENTATION=+ /assembly_acc=CAM_ASM_000159
MPPMPPVPPNDDAADGAVIAEDGNPKSNTSTGKTEEEVDVSPTDNSKQEHPKDGDMEMGGDVGSSMITPGDDGSHKKISSYRDMEDTRTNSFVVIVACAAALGGLIFGYDIGGAGATFLMDGFKIHFGWECAEDDLDCTPASSSQISTEQGLINGLFGTGAAIGAMIAPKIFNTYGRKPTMYIAAWTFIVGAALQTAAVSMPMLYVPRLLSGGGIGALSMCSPVYIAELAPEHIRGKLATLWQLSITTGIVLVSILNIWLAGWDEGWRISYGGNIFFALILIGMLRVMPESPRFLVGHGRSDEAKEALLKVRFEDQIEREMLQINLETEEEKERGEASWPEIFDNNNNRMKYRVLQGMTLQSIQQLSGINAIMFYAPSILESFFGSNGAIYGALALNVVNFFATFITIYTIERVGRVKLLFSGAIVMCLALIPNAILASLEQTNTVGILVVIFCAMYVIGFAYSWGPVVWVVCSEMFPLRERGRANGLTTFTNWFWTTIVGAVFPHAAAASLSGCFGFFAGICFLATFYVYLYLPETANRTIPEIDDEYANHKKEFPRKKW